MNLLVNFLQSDIGIVFLIIFFTSLIFLGCAKVINEKNAKYLLAGYNTMTKKEKEQFDLKSYLIFFKKFFINLAFYPLILAIVFYFLVDFSTMIILYSISITLPFPYFIYKSYKNFKL